MAQEAGQVQEISSGNHILDLVKAFTYQVSTISTSLSLDRDIERHIVTAGVTMATLSKRAWENRHLTRTTKGRVYQTCVLSTLSHGSELRTAYM